MLCRVESGNSKSTDLALCQQATFGPRHHNYHLLLGIIIVTSFGRAPSRAREAHKVDDLSPRLHPAEVIHHYYCTPEQDHVLYIRTYVHQWHDLANDGCLKA